MPSVASFGSINVDRVVRVDRATLETLVARHDLPRPGETRAVEAIPADVLERASATYLGGKGANQAVAAAAAGAETTIYGRVGRDRDALPVEPCARLAERGVETAPVTTADAPTGTAAVVVGPGGENRILIVGGANDAVGRRYVDRWIDDLARHDCLLVQHELPTATVDALFDRLDGRPAADRPTVVFDPAPAAGATDLLGHDCVDVVTPNRTEADGLDAALAAFEGTVVRTRGDEGVAVTGPDGAFTVGAPAVSPVDTTGAGDVFAGYLAAGLAADRPLADAVEHGCVAAALSVTREGVQRATPTADAVAGRRAETGRQG